VHNNYKFNDNTKFNDNSKFIDKNDGSPSRIMIKNEKEDNHNVND
jgi:hypothetical protein